MGRFQYQSACDIDESTCIKVYDPITKIVILQYETLRKCANELGVPLPTAQKGISLKRRVFSKSLDKEVACRLKTKDPDFKEIRVVDYLIKQQNQNSKVETKVLTI